MRTNVFAPRRSGQCRRGALSELPIEESELPMSHVVAIGTLVTADRDGRRIRLQEGTVWEDSDPFVRFRPDLFRPLDEGKSAPKPPVEQASAAPGEKRRGPGRPRKSEQ